MIITLTPGLASGFAAAFAGLTTALDSAALDSVFLVVTGAFDCADTGFTAVLDKVFAVGFARAFTVALAFALVFAKALLGDFFAIATVALTVALFTADFTLDLSAVDLAAAGFAFIAALLLSADIRVFADFFIAFAMESKSNACSSRALQSALPKPVMRPSLLYHFSAQYSVKIFDCAQRNRKFPHPIRSTR